MNGTNPVCPDYVEAFDNCGCENCGHSKGEHYPLTRVGAKAPSPPTESQSAGLAGAAGRAGPGAR